MFSLLAVCHHQSPVRKATIDGCLVTGLGLVDVWAACKRNMMPFSTG